MKILNRWHAVALVLAGLAATAAAQKKAAERLPYEAVHRPEFIAAASATFMSDSDRVIGITVGTQARCYPAAILAQHGLVEDQSPSGPIAITW
jgi:hypothetical protein